MSRPPGNTGLARMLAVRTLTTTVQIVRTAFVSDGRGGQLPGTPTTTTVRGLIRPSGASETELAIADRASGRSLWIIEVPLATAIDATIDRITEPSTGRAFEILAPLPATDRVTLAIACVESARPVPPATTQAGYRSPLWLLGMGA